MTDLPSGTLTLLFSDIEGSTRHLERLGRERYGEALGHHNRLVRDAVLAHDGVEKSTQGDSFFCVFATARDAVAAAADAQRALSRHEWPDGEEFRVRMGLHTGDLLVTDDYVGLDVHLAARIMSAAHGGQVLVSQTTRDLLSDAPPGIALRDLGEHRLKDLGEPQRLHQLVGDGLPPEFPPPRTLERRRTNLPTQPNRFVGRLRDLTQVADSLRQAQIRLLTLTGPAGTGKTRLALQSAAELLDDFEDGVFFVALVPVRDPDLVMPTVARTLGFQEQAGVSLDETLAEHLRGKQLLLVLDNFEHVVEAGAKVAGLLKQDSRVKLLVTSREALRVGGEHLHVVPPLSVPGENGAATQPGEHESVILFLERARAVRADFRLTEENGPVVADICRRLDGLPLAIELAASRIGVLSPTALLTRLDQRLKLLTGGARDADTRQRTLRDAIGWSYDLLVEDDQAFFARLAVFVGGFRLEAAETVCDASDGDDDVLDRLASLVEKSLLRQREDTDGEPRFWMLETIREYAFGALQRRGEAETFLDRHAAYFLSVAEDAEGAVLGGKQSSQVYAKLEAELGNLRAALGWAERAGNRECLLRLGGALGNFWMVRGHLREGRRWLESAAADDGGALPEVRAKALGAAGGLAYRLGEYASARELAGAALELWRELADEQQVVSSLARLGAVAIADGDLDGATELYEESVEVFRRLGETTRLASALSNLGHIAVRQQDYARASRLLEEAIELFRSAGPQELLAFALYNLGRVAIYQTRYEAAATLVDETLEIARALEYKELIGYCLKALGEVSAGRGAHEEAARLLGMSDALLGELGVPHEPDERETYERTIALLRERLGAAFADLHEDGRAAYRERGYDELLARPASVG